MISLPETTNETDQDANTWAHCCSQDQKGRGGTADSYTYTEDTPCEQQIGVETIPSTE